MALSTHCIGAGNCPIHPVCGAPTYAHNVRPKIHRWRALAYADTRDRNGGMNGGDAGRGGGVTGRDGGAVVPRSARGVSRDCAGGAGGDLDWGAARSTS